MINLMTNTKEIEKITFNNLACEWLLFKKHKIKKSTYYRYQYIINKYLNPMLGDKNIKELYNYNFNYVIDELISMYSIKSINDVICNLKSILKYGERKYDLDFKLDLVAIPKTIAKKVQILEKKEKETLENYCLNANNFRDIGLLICLNTGMRLGEICALTWKDIDLNKRLIDINKTMERIYLEEKKTVIFIDKPKSEKSNRKIPIANKLYKILKELQNEYNFSGEEFFLTGFEDKFVEPRNYQYYFKRLILKLKIKNNKFHILRHTFATNCIQNGMDIKSLSEVLGHSDVGITLNRYVHSSYDEKKKYLNML